MRFGARWPITVPPIQAKMIGRMPRNRLLATRCNEVGDLAPMVSRPIELTSIRWRKAIAQRTNHIDSRPDVNRRVIARVVCLPREGTNDSQQKEAT